MITSVAVAALVVALAALVVAVGALRRARASATATALFAAEDRPPLDDVDWQLEWVEPGVYSAVTLAASSWRRGGQHPAPQVTQYTGAAPGRRPQQQRIRSATAACLSYLDYRRHPMAVSGPRSHRAPIVEP